MAELPSPFQGRRRFLLGFAAVASLGLLGWLTYRRASLVDMARVAPFVLTKERWTADHYFNFLDALPSRAMLTLKRGLGLVGETDDEESLAGSPQDARDVQKHTLWLFSNVFAYPFRDETALEYHDVVTWVCERAGVPKSTIASSPTFALEQQLHRLLFAKVWDQLSTSQREALLNEIDPYGKLKDKAAIASLSGAGALAALSTTAVLSGFAFYTGMSVAIASAASAAGVTLPFAAYSGASTAVGFLSGPIGWATLAVAALGSAALAGRPNVRKTTALVMQVHALKVEALMAARVPVTEAFAD